MMSALLLLEIIQFRPQCCQKYASNKKKLQIKVVRNFISYKKVHEGIYIYSPSLQGGAMGLERLLWLLKYYIIYIVIVLKWHNYKQFMPKCSQKYVSYKKNKNSFN